MSEYEYVFILLTASYIAEYLIDIIKERYFI